MRLRVRVAWPWALGYFPPPGHVFLVDDDGAILMDTSGNLLTVPK
jgi:hypothetical protein